MFVRSARAVHLDLTLNFEPTIQGLLKMLRSRFRGAMVGALVGDCLGAYWESASWIGTHPIDNVKEKIEEQIQQTSSKKGPVISYTDDTALTFALAESLVECHGFDAQRTVRKMTETFFDDPRRGFGPSIGTVFSKLKNTNFADIHRPAMEQFKGQGSCGNGAAMRISPVGLFGYKDDKTLTEVCAVSSKLTHYHTSGVNGALLQAMAVKLALQIEGPVDPLKFVEKLLEQITPFEESHFQEIGSQGSQMDTLSSQQPEPTNASEVQVQRIEGQVAYTSRLQQMRVFLTQQDPPSAHAVQALLGHGVLAAEAVPCAIYAFLKCCNESFKELIQYAISLGGDTDTIGSMAGAIGGAYWGIERIPQEWVDCCEESGRALLLADQLYDLVIGEDPK